MGTDIILNNLLEKRIKLVDQMIINLGKNISSMEQILEIMDISDNIINEIKLINLEITKLGFSNYYDNRYEKRLKIALEAQSFVFDKIKAEKNNMSLNLKEIAKKDEVVKSY
ncbi:MAG TPA: hypothetical protein VIG40_08950, partial [Tissierellaceae bacterium]